MLEPDVVVGKNKHWRMLENMADQGLEGLTTRHNEQRIRELHKREASHVPQVDDVRKHTEKCDPERKAIKEPEHSLNDNDGVYQPRQKTFGDDAVLLNQLGQIVKS